MNKKQKNNNKKTNQNKKQGRSKYEMGVKKIFTADCCRL